MDQQFDIRHYLSVLRRRWYIFVIPVVLVSALSFAVATILPPVYVSTAKILIESQAIPEQFVPSSVTAMADERIEVIQQRVMTRANILEIARKFGLQETALKGASSSQIVDFMRQRVSVLRLSVNDAGPRRNRGVTIAFTVSFEHENPSLAAKITNELVTLILQEDVRTRTARAAETTEFLEREAIRQEQELAKIEREIVDYKDAHKDALPERLGLRLAELSNLQNTVTRIEGDIRRSEEEDRFAQLRPQAMSTGPLGVLMAQRERLSAELLAVSAVMNAAHPRRKQLAAQIDLVEQRIVEETAAAERALAKSDAERASMDPKDLPTEQLPFEMMVSRERQKSMAEQRDAVLQQIAELGAVIEKTPQVELGLATLSRRLDTAKTKLEDTWRKHADARLAERLEENQKGERFEVIEQPTRPTEPVKPDRPRILALGVALAFGAGGAGLVMTEMMDRSIRSTADLMNRLNVRPLVVIPLFVSREETLARRRRTILAVLAVILALIAALIAIHFFYMPVEDILLKISDRFQL